MRRGRASWRGGPDPGIGRWGAAGCAGAFEGLNDDHAAPAAGAWRAMVCLDAGVQARVVVLWRIARRRGGGDQFSGARGIGLSGGAGEQPVVAGAMETLLRGGGGGGPSGILVGASHGAETRLP